MTRKRQTVIVEMVSNDRTHVILNDGTIAPIRTMLDRFGDETDDPKEADVVVAEINPDEWITVDLDDFEHFENQ